MNQPGTNRYGDRPRTWNDRRPSRSGERIPAERRVVTPDGTLVGYLDRWRNVRALRPGRSAS